jgi:hypothetical protein
MSNKEIADRIDAFITERIRQGVKGNKRINLVVETIRGYEGEISDYYATHGELPPEVKGLTDSTKEYIELAIYGVNIADRYLKDSIESRILPRRGELSSRQRHKKH